MIFLIYLSKNKKIIKVNSSKKINVTRKHRKGYKIRKEALNKAKFGENLPSFFILDKTSTLKKVLRKVFHRPERFFPFPECNPNEFGARGSPQMQMV